MEGKLIKIDRNGSKHYEGMIKCDRCGGSGLYPYMVMNGQVIPTIVDNGVCHKCLGEGKVHGTWIERTPEYQAKLDAKRQAKREAEWAKREAELAERKRIEAEEKAAEEARIKAQKAISQYVGNIGDKVELKVTYQHSGSWTAHIGWMETKMFCHTFKDADGNVFTWKTQSSFGFEYGEPVIVKGTIKEHSEYKDEKQTVLTRCKVVGIV